VQRITTNTIEEGQFLRISEPLYETVSGCTMPLDLLPTVEPTSEIKQSKRLKLSLFVISLKETLSRATTRLPRIEQSLVHLACL
jgi:hypothetical protein